MEPLPNQRSAPLNVKDPRVPLHGTVIGPAFLQLRIVRRRGVIGGEWGERGSDEVGWGSYSHITICLEDHPSYSNEWLITMVIVSRLSPVTNHFPSGMILQGVNILNLVFNMFLADATRYATCNLQLEPSPHHFGAIAR